MLSTGGAQDKKQGKKANEEKEEVKAVILTIKWKVFQAFKLQQGFRLAEATLHVYMDRSVNFPDGANSLVIKVFTKLFSSLSIPIAYYIIGIIRF